MIDLHLHLLPGIDDGAADLGMTRAMLTRLASLGYTRVVATPHLMEPLSARYEATAHAALSAVRPLAIEQGITVDLGFEHVLVPGLAERLDAGEASTLAGSRAVLVELPFIGWPQSTESSLFSLQLAGYTPVLAHPERYTAVQKDRELALAVAERGVVLQLTPASFAGVFGKPAQQTALALLRESLMRDTAVVLATDAHSDGQRLGRVVAGLHAIGKQIADDDALVHWATVDVPTALLSDQELPRLDGESLAGFDASSTGVFGRLFRRLGLMRTD